MFIERTPYSTLDNTNVVLIVNSLSFQVIDVQYQVLSTGRERDE